MPNFMYIEPRAKFARYGQLLFFSLSLIVKTTFVLNFMYMGPFLTNLLRKTQNRKKGPRAKNSPWALGLNLQDMVNYFIFPYFSL